MTIPGFTAAAAIGRPAGRYLSGHRVERGTPETDVVVPAINWGSIADNGCQSDGTHKYSAILWNIPWGQSWEAACASTPGPAGTAVAGRLPDKCVTLLNEWGEWYLPDPHCPRTCPAGCYEANVACTPPILWNTCWCYSGGMSCPTGSWWIGGVCVGLWQLGCIA